ncbi:MAG: hypothetical protein K9H16_10420 [Bacteroidales bacterium]|nr:hypothetical protein [Bacteroidales bacterium]
MKNSIHKICFIFLAAILLFANRIDGQTNVQVVTKTLSGEERWTPGMKLEINGENAEIHCSAYSGASISWEVKLIARHADKSIAESDLDKLKWVKGKIGRKLMMRNYIELSADESKPQSNLKVIYNIKVPASCPISINNYFGEINIKNLKADLDINSEFAPVFINNFDGNLKAESNFGDIQGDSLAGKIVIISKRSNIKLRNISGNVDLDALFAEIDIHSCAQLSALNIEAEKSEINLSVNPDNRFLLDLENVEFFKPPWMNSKNTEIDGNTTKVNFADFSDHALINISLSIGTLEFK